MALIAKSEMAVLGLPRTVFNADNLSASSSYTESGLEPGVPTRSDVATSHTVYAGTSEGISEAYNVQLRGADGGGGSIGGPTAGTFIYRDTSETGADDDWMGWHGYGQIKDVWTVNADREGTSTYKFQYPRAALDKDGYIVCVATYDSRGVSMYRDPSTGVWDDRSTLSDGISDEFASASAVGDLDVCYDSDDDAFVAFYASRDGSASKLSIGVSISSDHGNSWQNITRAVMPFTADAALSNSSGQTIHSVRAEYNPISQTYSLAFVYQTTSPTYTVYTARVDKTFTLIAWGETIADRRLGDIVVRRDGREFLMLANAAYTTLYTYTREAGQIGWTSRGNVTGSLDADVGITGWVGHDDEIRALVGDPGAGVQEVYRVQSDGSPLLDTSQNYGVVGGTGSYLRRVAALRWRDRVLLFGNPQGVSTTHEDAIMAYHLGGWDNLPGYTLNLSCVHPWDTPQAQSDGLSWTDTASGSATISSIWYSPASGEPDYVAVEYDSVNGSSSTISSATGTGHQGAVMDLRAEVYSSFATIQSVGTSTGNGYFQISMLGYDGADRSQFRVLVADDEVRVLDVIAGAFMTGSVTMDFDNNRYFRVAYNVAAHKVAVWVSTDGDHWQQVANGTLTTSSDATAASITYVIATGNQVAGAECRALLSGARVAYGTTGTVAANLIDYNDNGAAYTSEVLLSGMPIARQPSWVTKGLEVWGTGAAIADRDYWLIDSVATAGVSNALILGEDSPRSKWIASATGDQVLQWDLDAPINLSRGLLRAATANVDRIKIEARTVGGSTVTMSDVNTNVTLSGTWARSGNTVYVLTSSSYRYWSPQDLEGGIVHLGSVDYYTITRVHPGFASSDAGGARLRLEIDGDPSGDGAATSGSDLAVYPGVATVLWYNSAHTTVHNRLIVTLYWMNGPVECGSLLICDPRPIPLPPGPGRSRGQRTNMTRDISPGGFSRGFKGGPTARTRTLSFEAYEDAARWSLSSSLPVNLIGWDDSSNAEAFTDANETLLTLEYAHAHYGSYLPTVWVDSWQGEPANNTVMLGGRESLLTYIEGETLTVSSNRGGRSWGNQVYTLDGLTFVEIP